MAAAADQCQASPTSPRLLILHRLPRFHLKLFTALRAKYTVLDSHADPPDPSFTVFSKSARVLLCVGPTPVTADDLDRYPAVECVVGSSAGLDHIDLAACRRRGVRVTTTGDLYSDDVADYAVGLAVDALRRISAGNRFVRGGSWPVQKEYTLGSKVSGKRVGIVGLGSIGSRVAKRLEAFGCRIAYTSMNKKPQYPSYTYYPNAVDISENSDILFICCPLTAETFHLINGDVMKALGRTGVIVNVGRGPLIDEKEMVRLLVRGELGGAGLDVFEHEPQVPEEMFKLDSVILSPHKSVFTPEAFAALEEMVVGNIEAFFCGKPLSAEIKPDMVENGGN